MATTVATPTSSEDTAGVTAYYNQKISELEALKRTKTENLKRLEAQRNELNAKGTSLCAFRLIC